MQFDWIGWYFIALLAAWAFLLGFMVGGLSVLRRRYNDRKKV